MVALKIGNELINVSDNYLLKILKRFLKAPSITLSVDLHYENCSALRVQDNRYKTSVLMEIRTDRLGFVPANLSDSYYQV